jgi:cysteine desulfurase/selenocysteine lyase
MMQTTTDWVTIRAQFRALSDWTYLNSATFGQVPQCAIEAVDRHWQRRDQLACGDFLSWYDDADRLRTAVASLIHASAEDIAFIGNTSTALALMVAGLDWRPGDNVVTLAHEFPNFLYLPALLEHQGVEFRETPWERFYESIDERTRLVALSQVNYSNGFRPPLEELSKFLRQRGVLLFVDGTQSVGALQFDVRKTQPDMLAVHGYKWLISPTGAGFVYVAKALRQRLSPREVGWRSHHTWREVDNLHHGVPEFKESAEKYESGGLPFPLLYAMEASVNLMLEIGPDVIERRVLELADAARKRMLQLGADAPETGSQIVSAKFPGVDPSDLARELKARHVLVAARHGHLRVSPHFYNTEEDLDRFTEELRALL